MRNFIQESLSYEEYAKQLEKGIDFKYEEFEKQRRDDWIQGYNLAYRFYIFHGTLDVPLDYSVDGFPLGHWVEAQRKHKKALTVNQKKLLDNIHMLWHLKWNHHMMRTEREIRFGEEQFEKWKENWLLAKKFFEENGHLNIPINYVAMREDGKKFKLGAWLQNQKTNFKNDRLPAERMGLLDSLFTVFDNTNQEEIDRILKVKDCNFLPDYLKGVDPFKDKPISVIFNNGHLSHKMRLQRNIGYLRGYFEKYNDLDIPQTYSVSLEDGSIINFGSILTYIRKKYREGKLNDEDINELEEMNIVWDPRHVMEKKQLKELKDSIESIVEVIDSIGLSEMDSMIENDYPLFLADEVELGYQMLDEQKGLTKK